MKFKIKTLVDAEDILVCELWERGFSGAQIEDQVPLSALEKEQMFVDILPEGLAGEEEPDVAYVSLFVELAEDGALLFGEERQSREEALAAIQETLEEVGAFCDVGEGSIEVTETEDLDWINNWKQYFHQFVIDDLLVIPSWEEEGKSEIPHKKTLHIDPGTAFGTGMHETTQLCIRQIKKHLTPGARLLDIGTGSGILSICALLYGAAFALGTDLDPCAEEAVAQNREANGIPENDFELLIGNIITEKSVQDQVGRESFDMVAANILAEVLLPLTPVAVSCLKPDGVFITSGIIEGKEDLVAQAMEAAGLTVLEVTEQGEWRSVTGRKKR